MQHNEPIRPRLSGYLIFCVLFFVSLARRFAEVTPVAPMKLWASRAARLETCDRIIPFVIVGGFIGLVAGMIAENKLPKWSHAYWLYCTIVLAICWALGILMIPTAMPR